MPTLQIDIDDKGEFIGQVPTELGAILERLKATAHGEGFGKGSQKAAEEAKAQIEQAIKAERSKLEATMPLEKAKWDEIDAANKLLKTQLESTATEARKQLTQREEAHALEITRKVDALTKRDAKIKSLVNATLRGLAAQAGARDESLSELEVILQHRVGYTEDMEPYVRGEDGEPAKTAAGNPLGLETFVRQYLDNHPHHKKPAGAKGGDARRGASLSGHPSGVATTIDAARQRIDSGDRSPGAIHELFEASRQRRSA